MSSLLFTKSYQITNNWTVNKNLTLSKSAKPDMNISHIQITAWLSVFYIENGRRKKKWHSWNTNIKQNETNIKMYLFRDIIRGFFLFVLPSPSWRNLRSSIWQQWGDCLLCEKAPNCRLFDTHLLPIEQQSKLAMF